MHPSTFPATRLAQIDGTEGAYLAPGLGRLTPLSFTEDGSGRSASLLAWSLGETDASEGALMSDPCPILRPCPLPRTPSALEPIPLPCRSPQPFPPGQSCLQEQMADRMEKP